MVSDKKIAKIDKLNIKSIDITKIIIKAPEISHEELEKLFTDKDINLIHVSGNLYLIESKKISEKICNLVDDIKKLQLDYFDIKENRNYIVFKDEIISQVCKFIVEANKTGSYDVDKVALILQNILGDIYQHPEIDKKFLDIKFQTLWKMLS